MPQISPVCPFQFQFVNDTEHAIECGEGSFERFYAENDEITVQVYDETQPNFTLSIIHVNGIDTVLGQLPYQNGSFFSWSFNPPNVGRFYLILSDGTNFYQTEEFVVVSRFDPCLETSLYIEYSHSCPILSNGIPNDYADSANFEYAIRLTGSLDWDRTVIDVEPMRDAKGKIRLPSSEAEDVYALAIDWSPTWIHRLMSGVLRHDSIKVKKGTSNDPFSVVYYRQYQMISQRTPTGIRLATGSGEVTLQDVLTVSNLCC